MSLRAHATDGCRQVTDTCDDRFLGPDLTWYIFLVHLTESRSSEGMPGFEPANTSMEHSAWCTAYSLILLNYPGTPHPCGALQW